jgi:uncharacterized membrane protein
MSINDSMAVTGYYYVSATVTRGFLREADGTITTFDVLGGLWTEPESINAAGAITGFYEFVAGVPRGFIRYADGHITTFDPPGFQKYNGPQAQPVSINEFGEIAGNYPYPLDASFGFTRSAAGVFKTFDFAIGAAYGSTVTGINANGTVAGYFSPDGVWGSSFILHPDGFRTVFDVPVETGEGEGVENEITTAESVNANGAIAGWYSVSFECFLCGTGTTLTAGGFVRSPQGVFTLFNPPGRIVALVPDNVFSGQQLSAPHQLSINQAGTITGSYVDAKGAKHGFLRNPYGTITSFDPPRGGQTTATGINDTGVIAGFYFYDWNAQIAQGFLRIPQP